MTNSGEAKQARKTVIIVASAMALLAAWNLHRHRLTVAAVLGSAAGILAVVGLAAPKLAAYFHRGWMTFAEALGYVNSRIILTILFLFVITPLSVLMKLMRRDPLMRRGPSRETYWLPRERTCQTAESFERTF